MIKAFQKLNIYHKCSVLSGLFILFLFICFIPFFFFNLMELPLGLLLGGGFGVLSYFVTGLFENKKDESYKWAVVISILRFVILGILLFLVGLCYYKWEVKIFNIFTVVGGYSLCLVVLIILFVLKDKQERKIDGSI